MRNKIKQLLKKEGGFTLVELLAVIAILALIVGIAIPMIGNVVQKSQVKADNAQIELIGDAARLYKIESADPPATEAEITIDDLIPEYLEEDVIGTEVNGFTIKDTTTIGVLKQNTSEALKQNTSKND